MYHTITWVRPQQNISHGPTQRDSKPKSDMEGQAVKSPPVLWNLHIDDLIGKVVVDLDLVFDGVALARPLPGANPKHAALVHCSAALYSGCMHAA